VPEIGYVSRMNNKLAAVRTVKNEGAPSKPVQPRPSGSVTLPPQPRLSFESAIRQVARAVTDYIVSNRLTHDDAYEAYRVEFFFDMPLAHLPGDEMDLIGELSAALAAKVALNPLNISTTELALSGTFLIGKSLVTVSPSNTLEQVLEKVSQGLASVLPGTLQGQGDAAADPLSQGPRESGQKFIMGWTLGTGVVQTLGEALPGKGLVGAGTQTVGAGAQTVGAGAGLVSAGAQTVGVLPIIHAWMSSAGKVLSADPSEGDAALPGGLNEGLPAGKAVSDLVAETSAGLRPISSEEGSACPDVFHADLKGLAGSQFAELRIRYDAATIVSKVAALSEHVNGMLRIYDEQAKGTQSGQQKAWPTISPSLRQALFAALSSVVEGNKVFVNPESVGIAMERDGLLTLDTTILRSALQSNREEAAVVIKSLANSFYDHMSLYVDPRVLAGLGHLPGSAQTQEVGRGGNEAERRWQKEKEQLEKRFRELGLVLEESGKLRAWFMQMVEAQAPVSEELQPEDEVVKRQLPAVDLIWDEKEVLPARASIHPEKAPTEAFIDLTSRALSTEDSDACIKLLLERKVLSDILLDEKPGLDAKDAMICLANEELLLGRLETERKKVFEGLDELSRTMVAVRGYRSQFPFPPPMAAFIASES
jgi:hypothetical protein